MRAGASAPRPGRFTPGNAPLPIVQEAGWVPGPVWTGAENLAFTGFGPRNVHPVASRYTRNISWGMKVAVRRTDNITTFMCLFIFLKSGNLNLRSP